MTIKLGKLKNGEFWNSGRFYYGRKIHENTTRTDTGWETLQRFEVVGNHQITFYTECRKEMLTKRRGSQWRLVASLPLYLVFMFLVGMGIYHGSRSGGPSVIIQILLVGFFVLAGWVFYRILRNKSEIRALKGMEGQESLDQLLDKEAIAIFRKTQGAQNPAEFTYWTRREFEALKKNDSLLFPR